MEILLESSKCLPLRIVLLGLHLLRVELPLVYVEAGLARGEGLGRLGGAGMCETPCGSFMLAGGSSRSALALMISMTLKADVLGIQFLGRSLRPKVLNVEPNRVADLIRW